MRVEVVSQRRRLKSRWLRGVVGFLLASSQLQSVRSDDHACNICGCEDCIIQAGPGVILEFTDEFGRLYQNFDCFSVQLIVDTSPETISQQFCEETLSKLAFDVCRCLDPNATEEPEEEDGGGDGSNVFSNSGGSATLPETTPVPSVAPSIRPPVPTRGGTGPTPTEARMVTVQLTPFTLFLSPMLDAENHQQGEDDLRKVLEQYLTGSLSVFFVNFAGINLQFLDDLQPERHRLLQQQQSVENDASLVTTGQYTFIGQAIFLGSSNVPEITELLADEVLQHQHDVLVNQLTNLQGAIDSDASLGGFGYKVVELELDLPPSQPPSVSAPTLTLQPSVASASSMIPTENPLATWLPPPTSPPNSKDDTEILEFYLIPMIVSGSVGVVVFLAFVLYRYGWCDCDGDEKTLRRGSTASYRTRYNGDSSFDDDDDDDDDDEEEEHDNHVARRPDPPVEPLPPPPPPPPPQSSPRDTLDQLEREEWEDEEEAHPMMAYPNHNVKQMSPSKSPPRAKQPQQPKPPPRPVWRDSNVTLLGASSNGDGDPFEDESQMIFEYIPRW